jgi:hypothetical protein
MVPLYLPIDQKSIAYSLRLLESSPTEEFN